VEVKNFSILKFPFGKNSFLTGTILKNGRYPLDTGKYEIYACKPQNIALTCVMWISQFKKNR